MRVARILHPDAWSGARVALDPATARHLEKVLRLRPGAPLEVLDGEGGVFRGVYRGPEPPQVEVIGPSRPIQEPLPLVVAVAAIRGPRLDWLVEKLSELGVARLVVLESRRSRTARSRSERWRRIARESAKQCGRARLLEVRDPVSLAGWLAETREPAARWLLDPGGEALRATAVDPKLAHLLVVGPEGGFDAEERARLREAGFQSLRLAPFTLRSETAAVAGASALAALLESGR